MKNMKRSIRRSHNERLKKRVKKHASNIFLLDSRGSFVWQDLDGVEHKGFQTKNDVEAMKEKYATKNFNNRTPCSCSGCGNPRRWFNAVTIQERKANDNITYECMEMGLRMKAKKATSW